MKKSPGLLDGLTRIDELLIENTVALNKLIDVLQHKQGDNLMKPLFLTYPSSGSSLTTISAGDTILNFEEGTITDITGVVTNMRQSLQGRGYEWARSFFIQSDKLISVQIDDNDPIIASEERDASGIYQMFKRIKLTAYEDTDVFVTISTSPDALINLISNAMVISDTKDFLGNRSYIGLGEHAARLGGLQSVDHFGNFWFGTAFNAELRCYNYSYQGNNAAVARTNSTAWRGNFSVKLNTGDTIDDFASMYFSFEHPVQKTVGIEIKLKMLFLTNDNEVELKFIYYTGTHKKTARVVYNPNDHDLCLFDASGEHSIATGIKVYSNPWYTFKMVADFDNNKYVWLLFNGIKYDISDYSIVSVVDTTSTPRLEGWITQYTFESVNIRSYIDYVLFTQNEKRG